jgi:DNA (cytosine-5)-methyltransferase 1
MELVNMTYLSLFSGIGGFDAGLDRAGFRCVGQVECDPAATKVLAHRWPAVPQFKDVRFIHAGTIAVRPDLICGGFPCQDLSVAGRRAGLAGERSGLWGEFRRIIADLAPAWVLIENVPGLLSSWSGDTPDSLGIKPRRGRTMDLVETGDFSVVTSGLAELGYGWAMRVLDAQWFGLAQQRRRVFIVGCAGADVRRAAEVLFERESLPWDSPPSRQAGALIAPCVRGGIENGSNEHGNNVAGTVTGKWAKGGGPAGDEAYNLVTPRPAWIPCECCENYICTIHGMHAYECPCPPVEEWISDPYLVAHALTSEGHDASEDGTERGTPIVPVPIDMRQASRGEKMTNNRREGTSGGAPGTGIGEAGDPSPTIAGSHTPAVAFTQRTRDGLANTETSEELAYCLDAPKDGGLKKGGVAHAGGVRRLTPKECCRLQGFPDDWLDGLGLSDSAKYRMLGNAVAVPVAEWIANRIKAGSQSA